MATALTREQKLLAELVVSWVILLKLFKLLLAVRIAAIH